MNVLKILVLLLFVSITQGNATGFTHNMVAAQKMLKEKKDSIKKNSTEVQTKDSKSKELPEKTVSSKPSVIERATQTAVRSFVEATADQLVRVITR